MPELRRLVTVVFADVVGSTALAEELDAEDVRALFTRYYALANVTSHGGIVAKLLGAIGRAARARAARRSARDRSGGGRRGLAAAEALG